MRCEIAAALLHNPKILFLDEPTIGLDAVSKLNVRKFIKELNKEKGTTIILTTHDVQDLEALTKRIMLIGKGNLLYDGSLNEIKKKYNEKTKLTVEYSFNKKKIKLENTNIIEQNENHVQLLFDNKVTNLQNVLNNIGNQVNITDVSVESMQVEEVIAKLYEEMKI